MTDGGPLWGCQASPSYRLVSTVYALSVLLYNLLITPIHERHGCIGCKQNLAARGMARRDRGRLCLDTGGTDNEERDTQPIRACGSPVILCASFLLNQERKCKETIGSLHGEGDQRAHSTCGRDAKGGSVAAQQQGRTHEGKRPLCALTQGI